MNAASISKHRASGGDEHACESVLHNTVQYCRSYMPMDGVYQPFTAPSRSSAVPVPDAGSTRSCLVIYLCIISAHILPLPHHIWRSYDDDDACKTVHSTKLLPSQPGPTCVSLLFHAAGDARSAIAVTSSRLFQAIICVLLRFNIIIFENHTLHSTC